VLPEHIASLSTVVPSVDGEGGSRAAPDLNLAPRIDPFVRGRNGRGGGAANPARYPATRPATPAEELTCCMLDGVSPPASHGEVAHPGATAVAPAGSPPDLHHSRRSSPLLCSLPDGGSPPASRRRSHGGGRPPVCRGS
jgi:hypothetical protein